MRIQKQIWDIEHQTAASLPSEMSHSVALDPSNYVVTFQHFLRNQNLLPPKIVADLGAGKGRNTFFLAERGYRVHAIDYIPSAIEFIEREGSRLGLSSRIKTYCQGIDEDWPFKDNFLDIAIDCFSSIDIETLTGREMYKQELLRCLKPGGYGLVTVVSNEDEIERELIKKYPGPENNSSFWPQNGKFQKNYDEKELREFYSDFEIIKLEKNTKSAFKLNRKYNATNFMLILRKHAAR